MKWAEQSLMISSFNILPKTKKPDKKSYPAFLNYLIYYFNIILSAPS